jgi:hypothetical protein
LALKRVVKLLAQQLVAKQATKFGDRSSNHPLQETASDGAEASMTPDRRRYFDSAFFDDAPSPLSNNPRAADEAAQQ